MTTLTIQTHRTDPPLALLDTKDLSEIAVFIADMTDKPEARHAVAAITAGVVARTGGRTLAPDPRDVPLIVRQREFAVAARHAAQLE